MSNLCYFLVLKYYAVKYISIILMKSKYLEQLDKSNKASVFIIVRPTMY